MSQKSAFTMVFYIVSEDLDEIDQPNAFGISKNAEEITLQDVIDNFPIQGQYVFRYRAKVQNNKVWVDLNQKKDKVPIFEGKILLKAQRISWNKANQAPVPVKENNQPQAEVQVQKPVQQNKQFSSSQVVTSNVAPTNNQKQKTEVKPSQSVKPSPVQPAQTATKPSANLNLLDDFDISAKPEEQNDKNANFFGANNNQQNQFGNNIQQNQFGNNNQQNQFTNNNMFSNNDNYFGFQQQQQKKSTNQSKKDAFDDLLNF